MQIEFVKRWLLRIVAALTLSAVYLYGYPSAAISYFVVDLLHVAIGIVVAILLLVFAGRLLREESLLARLGWISHRHASSAENVALRAYCAVRCWRALSGDVLAHLKRVAG